MTALGEDSPRTGRPPVHQRSECRDSGMTSGRKRRLLATFGGLVCACWLLSACGDAGSPQNACFGPCGSTPVPMEADAHGWHATATISGGSISETLTVPGPLTVETGCTQSLTIWVVDYVGNTVAPAPSSTPAIHCLSISLKLIPAGTTATFTASVRMPATGIGGATLHGQLVVTGQAPLQGGNVPVIILHGVGL